MDSTKDDSVTIRLSDPHVYSNVCIHGQGDPYTINTTSPTYTWSNTPPPYTWPNTSPTYTFSDLSITAPSPSSKITLTGDDADIEINGESIVGMLKDIRDRLNILQVSEEMEAEWDELRVLREQYEAKLVECREKSRAWAALKQAG